MKVGLVSPYDFASPGGVNDQIRGGINQRAPQRARRLAGDWQASAWVTAGVNPAYAQRGIAT